MSVCSYCMDRPATNGSLCTLCHIRLNSANAVRQFPTGATRDTEDGKLDYEGFLSPLALKRFAEYMHHHRKQSDGELRASDNWQKGIDFNSYMKSGFRHFFDWWSLHRGIPVQGVTKQEALCALMFNCMGYLHEELKKEVVTNDVEK